jgi:hypothetical protein
VNKRNKLGFGSENLEIILRKNAGLENTLDLSDVDVTV